MINLGLQSIEKGSQILEIQAALLRVMEKINFHPKEIHLELADAPTEGNLLVVFVVTETTDEELFKLRQELGNFRLKVLGKGKNELFLQVEAPKEEWQKLGKRYSYQEHPQSSPSRPTYEPPKQMQS